MYLKSLGNPDYGSSAFERSQVPKSGPDYMTASAPSDRVDWLLQNDQELGKKGAEHDDYRL
jgi:hypothetical protein